MNILGIDYGTKHIGLALGSTESGLAEPLTTLSSTSHDLLSSIHSLILEHHIDVTVIGVSEGSSGNQAKEFSVKLESLKLPIHFADETLSSQEATSKLLHKSRIKRTSSQHAAAAAIILERWMEAQH